MMTPEMIETFLAVERHRSITVAAQKLYVSQSTVSHRLKLLEQETGEVLFARHKGHRMVDLTDAGEAFLPIAQRWMSIFRDTADLRGHLSKQSLSIGSIDLINHYTFVPLYQQYLEECGDIHLNVWTYHSGELYQLLENRTIDIGYVYSQRRYPYIISEPVFRDNMFVICHRDSPYHDDMEPGELPAEQEVYLRWSSDYEIWHGRYWTKDRNLLTVGTGSQILHYLNVPGRWAIAPLSVLYSFAGHTGHDHIVHYSLVIPPPPRICYQITHRYPLASKAELTDSFSRRMRAFIKAAPYIEAL